MLYNISNFKEKVKTMSVESHEICTKYPRTYHLYWSKGVGSDDKIKKDLSNFEGKVVVVTEKLDGENTTMYPRYDLTGMHARSFDGAFDWTREWVRSVQIAIVELIKGYRVCGENMTAIHSITYDDLVSFFYIFSIWDEETNMCLSWEDTVAFAEKLDIPTPKVLYHGVWDEELFKQMFEDMDTERFTIQCVLNHTDKSVTGVYDRSRHIVRKRRALELWENLLFDKSALDKNITPLTKVR